MREPRPQVEVIYELELVTIEGESKEVEFSHTFDKELYEHDVDGTDVMMVNFKMQEFKDVFLLGFSIERMDVAWQ